MNIGFTGTQNGMTDEQRANLLTYLANESVTFHHGDCIGADAEAHELALYTAQDIVVHPPIDERKRAFCVGANVVWREPLAYLDRDRAIVDETIELFATPALMAEELRSGTWATIRYARKQGKPVTIIWPDGTVEST